MGRNNGAKKNEEVLNPAEGVTENVAGEEAEKVTSENAPAEKAEAKIAPAEEAAPVAKAEEKVTVVMPRFLFTSDIDVTHHEVVYLGKVYQVQYDEPVEVPAPLADIINNAIAQKKKVRALIKSLDGKAKEISNE